MNGHLRRCCILTLMAFTQIVIQSPIVAAELAEGLADPPPAAVGLLQS